MLILRKTHDLILASLRAQLSDSRQRERFLEERLQAQDELQLKLIDRILAREHPVAAALLRPPAAAPAPSLRRPGPDDEDDTPPLPDPPGDIERYLAEQRG